VLWGYQLGDDLINLPDTVVKPDMPVSVSSMTKVRKPVLTHSGFGDPRISEPYPDTTSTINGVAAVCGRLLKQTPSPDPKELENFGLFVDKQMRKRYHTVKADSIKSTEEWINSRNRPGSWKRELHRELSNVEGDVRNFTVAQIKRIQAHIKQETYPEFKMPRGIFARQNPNKLFFGPLINAIEEIVYSDPQFIKHVPVADRPKYISDMLGDFPFYACSDFKSFEGSFSLDFQRVCEYKFFMYMISDLPSDLKQMYTEMFDECILGEKHITMAGGEISFDVEGLRMSGEMWTSLANGFSNLMLWKYFCKKNGVKCVGVVEGDDGLFGFYSKSSIPTTKQFADLGFDCKINLEEDLYRASFCGIVFDEAVNVNITDPRPFLASLAWLPYKYHNFRPSKKRSLMRAKALSFIFQYPGCPVIQSAALFVLRRTQGLDVNWVKEKSGFFNAYEEDEFKEIFRSKIVSRPVAQTTRELMFLQFDISIEMQLELESFFDHLDTNMFQYPDHILNHLFPLEWSMFVANYKCEPVSNPQQIIERFDNWNVRYRKRDLSQFF
jgi:hypothetical protein